MHKESPPIRPPLIPVGTVASEPRPARKPTASISPVARSNRRILLADDDSAVRESLGDVLIAEGYTVIPAENGQEALELAASIEVDLVLLDLNMPVKNGWDAFERLTVEHPLVPVIIVTARPNQLFTAVGAGVGALLEKPMDIKALLRTIENLLTESNEVRLKRLAGRSADFYYNAGKC